MNDNNLAMHIPDPETAFNEWMEKPLLAAITGDATITIGPTMGSMVQKEHLAAVKMAWVSGYTTAFEKLKQYALSKMGENNVAPVMGDAAPKTPQ